MQDCDAHPVGKDVDKFNSDKRSSNFGKPSVYHSPSGLEPNGDESTADGRRTIVRGEYTGDKNFFKGKIKKKEN